MTTNGLLEDFSGSQRRPVHRTCDRTVRSQIPEASGPIIRKQMKSHLHADISATG